MLLESYDGKLRIKSNSYKNARKDFLQIVEEHISIIDVANIIADYYMNEQLIRTLSH
jgi:hypothetical protein